MNFTSVIASLTKASWRETSENLIQHRGTLILSGKESRMLLKDAQAAIDENNQQKAQNTVYAGLLLDESRFLAGLQKNGLLRSSRHSYVAEPLTSIVSALLSPQLDLSATVTDYLRSVSNLLEIARDVRKEYLNLRDWIDQEREVGIKSALAWLDYEFLNQTIGFHKTNKVDLASRDPFFFAIEELSEGFSSLLALYGNEFGELTQNPAIDEHGLLNHKYLWILISSAHVSAFREWEFQVDRQGYQVLRTGQSNEFRLSHPSPEFHRSVELGFIQVTQQRDIKTLDWLGGGGKSFHEFAPQLMKSMDDAGLIRLLEEPAARFRFDFPAKILELTAQVSELFLEERIALQAASRDLLTPPEQILDFEIHEGVTFRDLFQVSRLFQFIRSITAAKLIPEMKTRPNLVFQSIVPAFERDQLVVLLSQCISEEKAEKVIKIWMTDVKDHVDIQYRPMLPAGTAILLPANVFASSNVYRNPLIVMRRRLYESGTVDPLSILLDEKFKAKGHDSKTGFEYDRGEIDLLVFIDGILFALECKNSILPSGAHELMTSLDYVRTAVEQFDRFKDRLTDRDFRIWLSDATGWPIHATTHLSTGIVLSNRMFMGLRENGHPVRGAYELEHFIDEGTATMGGEIHRYWIAEEFTGEDLRRYLEEDITHRPFWDCLVSYEARFQFVDCKLLVGHSYLNPLALAEHFGFSKAKQGIIDQQAEFERAFKDFSLPDHYEKRFTDAGGSREA